MTNWYQSSESLAMEDAQWKTEFQNSKVDDAIRGLNHRLDEPKARIGEQFTKLEKSQQELLNGLKWQEMQMKNLAEMVSNINRDLARLFKSAEGEFRFNVNSPETENLDLNVQNQEHRVPTLQPVDGIQRERRPMLEIQRDSERSSSLSSGNREVVVEEFNKLVQTDDVEAYTKKFEELRTGMLSFKPRLSELYFVTSYISGLNDEIRNLVKLSRPKTLTAAYEEARMQYDVMQALISDLEEPAIFDIVASEIMDKSSVESFDSIEITLDDLKVNSIECSADSSAYNVFDEMPNMKTEWNPHGVGTDLNLELKSNPEANVRGQEMNWHTLGKPPEKNDVSCPITSMRSMIGIDFDRGNPNCLNKIEILHSRSGLIEKHQMVDFNSTGMSFLVFPYAHQVFGVMPTRGFHVNGDNAQLEIACLLRGSPHLIFDPGGTEQMKLLNSSLGTRNFDRHLLIILDNKGSRNGIVCAGNSNCMTANGEPILMPFDRGKLISILCSVEVQGAKERPQWDPGGNGCFWRNSIPKPLLFLRKEIGAYECFKEQVSFKVLVFDPGIFASLHYCALCSQSSSLRFLVFWLLEISPWICDANFALPNRAIGMIAWSLRCELWVGFVATENCDCNCKSFVAVNIIATLGANMELMSKRVLVFFLAFLVLSDGFSSVSASIPPAKIASGVLSNAITKLIKLSWSLKTTTKTAISSHQMMKFESGYEVETVFDGSKLGIEPYSVELLPSGELLILDSANSNLCRISSSLSQYTRFFSVMNLYQIFLISAVVTRF